MAARKKKKDPKKEAEVAEEILIREVDDEIRAEKLQAWWQKFGSMIVAGCVTLVVATIAYQLASSYRTSAAEESTTILLQAQKAADKGQTETAINTLKPLFKESSAAADLAKLKAAYLKPEQADFAKIAQEAEQKAVRATAQLQAASPEMSKESIFYPLEAERHIVSLLKEDKKQEARTLLLSLLDRNDLPSSQRQRLNELLQGAN